MGDAYRDEGAALRLQVDRLREELATAEEDRDEQERLREELDAALAELKAQRLTEAEREEAARRVGRRHLAVGVGAGLVAVGTAGAAVLWLEQSTTAMVEAAASPMSARAWFGEARPHCNPVEAATYLAKHPPPEDDPSSQAYVATCQALAHRIADARGTLAALPPDQQSRAIKIVFDTVHPIADAGDDVAAGPVMELVLELWPTNYMAQFHAGMAAYQKQDDARARRHLELFLETYTNKSIWRRRAEQALAAMDRIQAGETTDRPKIPVH